MKKIAIIDDDGFIRKYFGEQVTTACGGCGGQKPDTFKWIPEDLSVLDQYDVLVVDNEGIGNETYPNGVEFIRAYAKEHPDKKIIHYSGWVDRRIGEEFKKMGVDVYTKGFGSDEIAEAVARLAKG